jgi:hypothetical protein
VYLISISSNRLFNVSSSALKSIGSLRRSEIGFGSLWAVRGEPLALADAFNEGEGDGDGEGDALGDADGRGDSGGGDADAGRDVLHGDGMRRNCDAAAAVPADADDDNGCADEDNGCGDD